MLALCENRTDEPNNFSFVRKDTDDIGAPFHSFIELTWRKPNVRDAIISGALLAATVLFEFLCNWKVTFGGHSRAPAVLAITGPLLRLLGTGLNIMTLGGAAAAVGQIIDDTIVMVEHVIWWLRVEAGGVTVSDQHVLSATREFTHPLAGSSAGSGDYNRSSNLLGRANSTIGR